MFVRASQKGITTSPWRISGDDGGNRWSLDIDIGDVRNIIDTRVFLGGEGTSVEILSKFWSECRNTFCQKWGFFENFRDTSTQITPKITFYCISINKFHKNFEKSAQKIFAAPSAPKTCRNISIFYPLSIDGNPPRGVTPKNNTLIEIGTCITNKKKQIDLPTRRANWRVPMIL